MNKYDLIELKYLQDFKSDKINRVARLDAQINELNRLKSILLNNIEKINADIKEIENKYKG